ncbi:TM0106 family RecB-like putative nuclease [Modestobacter lapidis]|nr:TM0106 family RecB-like putative nuclease [Modestobacter lapidis]
MQRIDGRLVLSPTDLTRHQECPHLTRLDLDVADGRLAAPAAGPDEELELIFALGRAHEDHYLAALEAAGKSITTIPTAFDAEGRRAAEAATVAAMRSGVDVVYQGTFFDGAWGGQADFLLRVEQPSALGSWSYEIADTKLARRMKVAALLQMATYADRLETLQGRAPERISVVTGDGAERPWRLVDVSAYARRARRRLQRFIDAVPATAPVPIAHCTQCRWAERCDDELRDGDDLSLVAGMRRDHRDALRDAGISTVEQLAGASQHALTQSGIGAVARTRLHEQAQEQVKERQTGEPSRTLLAPAEGKGLLRLPPPNPGDLYLDFEGDPYFGDGESLEYLAGIRDVAGTFTPLWAHSRGAEKQLVADLVDRLIDAWKQQPGMHVYHYAPYEVTALKKLTGRYGVREAELDQLLRGERFVDLYPVVRQSMRISKESYSIKKVEAFYGREHDGTVADAMGSVLAYERWIVSRDQALLDSIESYNKDDVDSTYDLHVWLEEQRDDLEAAFGPQPRPEVPADTPVGTVSDAEAVELDLVSRLQAAGTPVTGMLADLVQWHRREARPTWWEVFRLEDLEDDELLEDASPLGGLSEPVDMGPEKRSRLYEYTFPPQDTRLKIDGEARDVDSHDVVGTVFDLDPVTGRLVLKSTKVPSPSRGLGPGGPLGTEGIRQAIRDTGEDALAGNDCLGIALLERRVPVGTVLRHGETTTEAIIRLGLSLDCEVLAVQGPPGSGKTRAGAELIRRLLDAGKKVGVTANSHAVIGNLLDEVGRPALHKCEEDQHCGGPLVRWSKKSNVVADALRTGMDNLVGGTAWFWSLPGVAEAVDVLVVDEAGQFSLANAVAVARGAKALVLLGDPQQLAQPTQATHPGSSGVSVLEHLLDGAATIPADRGIFLDRTYRMHPALTAFVSDLAYEGRLASAAGLERVTVLEGGAVSGSGLAVRCVDHRRAAAAQSPEEADVVADLWRSLQGVGWVDRSGTVQPIGVDDVLVVAPYNNQVGLIQDRLPGGARIGTVDKFQGQQAPVVIYSMTSTSADDAPRGISFLYDLHRLNVAVSRAQALTVVVMSPELLDAPVRHPEQVRRVNALCRLVEMARDVS